MKAVNGKSFTTVNGKSYASGKMAPTMLSIAMTTLTDVIIFLVASLGHIIQAFYYTIAGCPKKDLKGELALVTGGGGGLGRLLALRLSKLGVDIVIWDINLDGINETMKEVKAIGGKCYGYKVDISKKEEVYKAADEIRKNIGDITMLINNAGVVSGRAFLDTPDHLIERSFNVNVLAHFWTTKAFLPAMLEKDHGHIVTIASMAGHVGISKLVDYCSSKFAAVGFDEALRMELENLGTEGVITTCICPFFIQATGMFEDVNARWVPTLSSEDVANRVIRAICNKEKCAILPGYLQIMLSVKWIFPWGCASGFLRRIVPDAAPQHGIHNGMPPRPIRQKSADNMENITSISSNNFITNNNNNNNKGAALLVQRTLSIGERVL